MIEIYSERKGKRLINRMYKHLDMGRSGNVTGTVKDSKISSEDLEKISPF